MLCSSRALPEPAAECRRFTALTRASGSIGKGRSALIHSDNDFVRLGRVIYPDAQLSHYFCDIRF